MPVHPFASSTVAAVLMILAVIQTAPAQNADSHFHRGYYLQHERGDIEGALAAYEAALDAGAGQETQRKVRAQIDAIQEGIAARDLARLMPPNALAYVEFARPADHLERLLRSMGLVDHQPTGERVLLPLDEGLALPSDFQFSPALLEEFKKVHGVAVAITEIDFEHEHPNGVAVIHTGSSNLLQGLIDTGVQVVPRQESIGGRATYCLEDKVWLVKTNSLLLVSPQRDQIKAALARIKSSGDSLAANENFRKCQAEREAAMIFAFVDGAAVMSKYGSMMQGEAAVARMVLGLDHLQHMTASIGATEAGAAAQVRFAFNENHNSLAYGLIRTVPLKDATLKRIPAGSAMVGVLGINPQLGMLAGAADAPKQITGLDLGRELFANIKEVGLFVIPSVANDKVPDFGIAFSAHDAQKSELLWNQLLTLSSQIEDSGITAEDISVAGRDARRYTLPDDDAPQLVVLRLDDETMVIGTEAAAKSATTGNSVLEDESLAGLIAGRSEHACKAVFLHVGRMLKLAQTIEGNDNPELQMMEKVMSNAHVSFVSEESPTEFKLRLEASGMPLFEDLVKTAVAVHHDGGQRVSKLGNVEHTDYDRHETDEAEVAEGAEGN